MGGRESGLPGGDEGGVIVETTGGGVGITTSGDRERFRPGENEGGDEGSYRSKELTRENACGWG